MFSMFTSGNYIINKGILFNTNKNIKFYQFSERQLDFDASSQNSLTDEPSLGYYAFNVDTKVIQYQKQYLKFSTTLASIGGCINIVLTLSQFINWFVTRNFLEFELINSIVSVDESNKKTSEKDKTNKIETNKQKDISMIKFNNILKKKDSKELLVKNKFSLLFCPKIFTKKNLEIKHYDRLTNCLGTFLGVEMLFTTMKEYAIQKEKIISQMNKSMNKCSVLDSSNINNIFASQVSNQLILKTNNNNPL